MEIINRQRKHAIRPGRFQRLLDKLARRYHLHNPEVALAFVGSQAIRTLNRKYMKKDRPTDVLSFPMHEMASDGRFYLGDIVVAVPVAAKQARHHDHSLGRELELLVVHGFLHLLGFNHSQGLEEEEEVVHYLVLGIRR